MQRQARPQTSSQHHVMSPNQIDLEFRRVMSFLGFRNSEISIFIHGEKVLESGSVSRETQVLGSEARIYHETAALRSDLIEQKLFNLIADLSYEMYLSRLNEVFTCDNKS